MYIVVYLLHQIPAPVPNLYLQSETETRNWQWTPEVGVQLTKQRNKNKDGDTTQNRSRSYGQLAQTPSLDPFQDTSHHRAQAEHTGTGGETLKPSPETHQLPRQRTEAAWKSLANTQHPTLRISRAPTLTEPIK
ncbi:hypothetical protein F511_06388 [Dorcoceras hygrometricum]|uniref:Uncharacterized protein n=1 Tax=Dorcoceras hygrometricum TaxID=472368 RepID=A0A2Z7AD02_9LAMI|nr:hypothetical protein F511_06388 [Dorcoceras hygrometricum]